uniref:Palmitoyltransferase n=1 Tax=Panagrellus redivivus TaxID=6233 RepID=A0A7E4VL16_PANRE
MSPCPCRPPNYPFPNCIWVYSPFASPIYPSVVSFGPSSPNSPGWVPSPSPPDGKIIFSYVERNRNTKLLAAAHVNGNGGGGGGAASDADSKNYLFSRRLRDDEISPCDCDSLLDEPSNGGGSARLLAAQRESDRKRRHQGRLVVDMRPSTSVRANANLNRSREIAQLAGKRKWRLHEGRNRFFCDGLLMTTRQSSVFLLTMFLITATFTMFCVFDAPYLTHRVSIALPIIAGVMYIFVIGSLLKTSFTDPGIIPRPSNREAIEYDRQCAEMAEVAARGGGNANMPRIKFITVKGQSVKVKFCFTCRLFRPPRASHCSICDNCVMNFDHHCPWVGNCVGLRNYRYFYFFITSLAILDLFIASCTAAHLALLTNETKAFIDTIRLTPVSIVVELICVISIWSIVGLSGFHTYLLATSQTTNEDIKGTFNNKLRPTVKNPYSTGNCCKNIFSTLCAAEPPSLLDRRGIIEPDIIVSVDPETRARFSQAYRQTQTASPSHSYAANLNQNPSTAITIDTDHDAANGNVSLEPVELHSGPEDDEEEVVVGDTECMPRHSFGSLAAPQCANGFSTAPPDAETYRPAVRASESASKPPDSEAASTSAPSNRTIDE